MNLGRISLVALVLAPLSHAQLLEVSEFHVGRPVEIAVRYLSAGDPVQFDLRLSDRDGELSARMSLWRHADARGLANVQFNLPAATANLLLSATASFVLPSGSGNVLSFTGPVTAVGSSPTPATDAFDGTSLDASWSLLNANLMSHSVSNGALHIVPNQAGPNVTWVHDAEGPFIYKTLVGDFDVRTSIHAESALVPGAPVPPQYRLGGLMVRDASSAPGAHHSAHIAVGAGSFAFPIAVEDKTTYFSNSNWFFQSLPSADLELRITRSGDQIARLYRQIGATNWTLMRMDSHPEFVAAVQVGLMSYCYDSPADIRASFDWVQIF